MGRLLGGLVGLAVSVWLVEKRVIRGLGPGVILKLVGCSRGGSGLSGLDSLSR